MQQNKIYATEDLIFILWPNTASKKVFFVMLNFLFK